MLQLKNDGGTALLNDINANDVMVTVLDGSVLPQINEIGDWFPLTFIKGENVERMQVIGRDENSLTVIRGAEGTKAQAWLAGDICSCNLTEAAIKATSGHAIAALTGGTVVNRIDGNGNVNTMVKIMAFTRDTVNEVLGEDIGTGMHPAFIRPDGTYRTHFEYGMYIASNDGSNNPISAAYKDPYANVTIGDAKIKCATMGEGWHMSTNAQWAAIVWLCKMNGWKPTGNTNHGRSHEAKIQVAIRQDAEQAGELSGLAMTLAGSGPLEWRHNAAANGIADMVGNTWEWQDGFKQVEGQIVVDEVSGSNEADWVAQDAWYNGNSKLAPAKTSDATAGGAAPWASQQKDDDYVDNALLRALLIEPSVTTGDIVGRLYFNNTITGFPLRGGPWSNGSNAGLGALSLYYSSSNRLAHFGFRPAFSE